MLIRSVLICAVLWTVTSMEFSKEKLSRYREKAKDMFYHAYNGYLDHAFPYDELKPISCTGMDTWGSFSLTLVDALDTLIILGNYSEFERAARLVLKTVNLNANVNVSVFETNIRVIGGLISAHMLSGIAGVELGEGWPCNGPLLRLAERMADKLLPAFNTFTGMPYGTVNLRYGVHVLETPVTCTAGVGTFLLEFAALSRLTGNPHYERVAMKALKELWLHRSAIGLVGNHINVQNGQWTATDAGIGAGVDSYFEYLLKGGMMYNKPALVRQFKEYKTAIEKHVRHTDGWFFWVSMTKGQVTMPVFQSLEQFWPGLISLIGEVGEAKNVMLNYHHIVKQYGFSPEFFNVPTSEAVSKRSGYPLRPEFVESLVYLYQATKDPLYLTMGVDVFEAIELSAKTKCGYATVQNVIDHTLEDRMESFFLAETTKYLYLLFDVDNFMHKVGEGRVINTTDGSCVIETGGYFFNTEAHPLDPSIIYCCSAHKRRDMEVLEKFQNNIDLMSLMGIIEENENELEEDIDADSIFNPLVPSRSDFLKELTIPTFAESFQSVHRGSIPMESNASEIGYEKDPNYSQQPSYSPTGIPGGTVPPETANDQNDYETTAKNRKLLGVEDEVAVEDQLDVPVGSCSVVKVTWADVFQKPSDWQQLCPSEELLEMIVDRLERFAATMPSLVKDSLTSILMSPANIEFYHKLIGVPDEPEPTECRIYDKESDSRQLRRFLHLVYNKNWQETVHLRHPFCFKSEPPQEEDLYNNIRPDTTSFANLEKDSYLHGATVDEIQLRNFNIRQLGEYQYGVMSCPSYDFAQRLSILGQIVR